MDELINITYRDLMWDLLGLAPDAVLSFDTYLFPDPKNPQEMPIVSVAVSRSDVTIDSKRIKWFASTSNGKLPCTEEITLTTGIKGKRIWTLFYATGYTTIFEK